MYLENHQPTKKVHAPLTGFFPMKKNPHGKFLKKTTQEKFSRNSSRNFPTKIPHENSPRKLPNTNSRETPKKTPQENSSRKLRLLTHGFYQDEQVPLVPSADPQLLIEIGCIQSPLRTLRRLDLDRAHPKLEELHVNRARARWRKRRSYLCGGTGCSLFGR